MIRNYIVVGVMGVLLVLNLINLPRRLMDDSLPSMYLVVSVLQNIALLSVVTLGLLVPKAAKWRISRPLVAATLILSLANTCWNYQLGRIGSFHAVIYLVFYVGFLGWLLVLLWLTLLHRCQ